MEKYNALYLHYVRGIFLLYNKQKYNSLKYARVNQRCNFFEIANNWKKKRSLQGTLSRDRSYRDNPSWCKTRISCRRRD